MSLRIISPLGATNISKLYSLQMNVPNFSNLQKPTLCRVSKFLTCRFHCFCTQKKFSVPKRNEHTLSEILNSTQLVIYLKPKLLHIIRVPHYHIVHRILSSDMMHPFPRCKFPPKNSSIPRENGHISEINNDPDCGKIERKKERIS